jgi:hypothetical protein
LPPVILHDIVTEAAPSFSDAPLNESVEVIVAIEV